MKIRQLLYDLTLLNTYASNLFDSYSCKYVTISTSLSFRIYVSLHLSS